MEFSPHLIVVDDRSHILPRNFDNFVDSSHDGLCAKKTYQRCTQMDSIRPLLLVAKVILESLTLRVVARILEVPVEIRRLVLEHGRVRRGAMVSSDRFVDGAQVLEHAAKSGQGSPIRPAPCSAATDSAGCGPGGPAMSSSHTAAPAQGSTRIYSIVGFVDSAS